MLIKAATGALVRDPVTKLPLPNEGGDEDPVEVSDTDLFWARMLRDGDVVPCKRTAKPSKKDEQA